MRTLLFTLLLSFTIVLPTVAVAQQDFVPLVGIPFVDEFNIDENSPGLSGYVNSLYRAAIIVAAVLAVAKIVIAGVQYMITDIGTQKGQAKKTIRGAVFGLLLVIGAVLVLETINPTLTSLNSLSGLQGITGTQEQVTVSLPGNSIDEACEEAGGNRTTNPCEVISCDKGDQSVLGALWTDGVACEKNCNRLRGTYIDNYTLLGMRDSCVVPQNSQLAQRTLFARECELTSSVENGFCTAPEYTPSSGTVDSDEDCRRFMGRNATYVGNNTCQRAEITTDDIEETNNTLTQIASEMGIDLDNLSDRDIGRLNVVCFGIGRELGSGGFLFAVPLEFNETTKTCQESRTTPLL